MLSILDSRSARLCDGISRRELLRVGGLSALGLSLPHFLAGQAAARDVLAKDSAAGDPTFGRAKSVIFLWLAGGPPQHETFDPKPDASLEVRGPFKPISTNVPGIQFCELLPRTAALADKLAIIRSLSTSDNTHDSSGYWLWTGYKYVGPNSRTIQPTDWPYFGSLVKKFKPSEKLPPLSTVWLPDIARLNENVTPAGQTAGILGSEWDIDRFQGDPSLPNYRVQGLELSDLPPLRLKERQDLLSQIGRHFGEAAASRAISRHDQFAQQAFDLVVGGKAREAFAIEREPQKVRERYGLNRWGQCVLLARRLVEAGVRLVHVQWPREPGDNAADNPLWDTHAQNAERMEDVLCPQFDVGFSALIEDLSERGLLEETLVVAVGEFGRTPKINPKGGRDHWGPVFSCALAGAGIAGGQVYGSSDKQGGYPATDKVEPPDFTATLFHLLGIPHGGTFLDRDGRPHKLTLGSPLTKLLGTEPATSARCRCTGDVARVPPFDEKQILLDGGFSAAAPLAPADGPARPRGWRGATIATDEPSGQLLVMKTPNLALLGFGLTGRVAIRVEKGAVALLAQEVRSPFSGTYTLTVRAAGIADSPATLAEFHKHFACKLTFFEYTDAAKKATLRKELASAPIVPEYSAGPIPRYQPFSLSKEFINPTPGQNFSFGLGLGIAVIVEKTSDGLLELPAGKQAALAIGGIELVFTGKPRDDEVKV
ncbi:MAG TPA: DUF1501 domain-containing protein [Pirellulaceae bacterium]|nr:DUF1501 domain-containing protein [Pirellulaceae bacterium]